MSEEFILLIGAPQNKSFEENELSNTSNVRLNISHKPNFKNRKKEFIHILRNFLIKKDLNKANLIGLVENKMNPRRFYIGNKGGIKFTSKKKECPRCKNPAEKTYIGKANRPTCFCSNCQALFA